MCTRILVFDVEIKTTKLVKGRGLYENISMTTQAVTIIEESKSQYNLEIDWIK